MRIITGSAKGCRLKAPSGMRTRPTSDRVKESLFSILGDFVRDKEVLDLFSGTGALGLEALSRGAARAVFVDRATARLLRENAERAHLLDRSEILCRDALSEIPRLAAAGRSFPLIFCDPPYGKGLWERALQAVDRAGLLAPEGILAVEHGGEEPLPADGFRSLAFAREIRYGRTTCIRLFRGLPAPAT